MLQLKGIRMKLMRQFIEKPWGRADLAPAFGAPANSKTGEIWYQDAGPAQMPLLVKWLFTSEKLSIQVHPSQALAKARGLPSGKDECWYIVDAEPGAVVGIGTVRPLSPDALRAASLSGEIEHLIDWKPVKPGDFYYIPGGTVHAIGAGIKLVEVQQACDITYRLFDYHRPRQLHLDAGVAAARAAPYADDRSGPVRGGRRLVSGPYFWLDYVEHGGQMADLHEAGSYWLIPLAGGIRFGDVPLQCGDCFIAEQRATLELEPDAKLLIAGNATG